jgi:ankyrin repeat protein
MGKLGVASDEYEHAFGVLLDTVLYEPHKVKDIVAKDRSVLVATNHSGENVLAWLALENHLEGVKLLRKLGSPIPDFALYEAIQSGHTDMVILLLELGAEVSLGTCSNSLHNKLFRLSKKKKRLIQSYFQQYGYAI